MCVGRVKPFRVSVIMGPSNLAGLGGSHAQHTKKGVDERGRVCAVCSGKVPLL
jgi:hypothetical protein